MHTQRREPGKKRCSSKGLSSMATTNQLGKKFDWEV
ncbi:hypothetical protein NC652_026162 [Populus alba x Populus x berolinensis]|nr:hypothetical protein NC652_026158 [Populus alba x Populus x berolinensis]KAJ6899928.1 hypothetical protein NC652_026162 [Populus alba x Populus x berolinensis]